jgi:D-serine deaminase-like pyridoxal phosphate-dependent protein
MGYEGHCQFILDAAERRSATLAAMAILQDAVERVRAAGLDVECVSAGGTGTHAITGDLPFITEIEAGSYIFMDARYRPVMPQFACALTVLTTVTSRPNPNTIIGDCGLKAITNEFGMPEVLDLPGATIDKLNEEHYRIVLAEPDTRIRPGDKLRLLPSHCDTTLNLYDAYHVIRGDDLEAAWPIAARGKSQ